MYNFFLAQNEFPELSGDEAAAAAAAAAAGGVMSLLYLAVLVARLVALHIIQMKQNQL